jgi:hypothetical protein
MPAYNAARSLVHTDRDMSRDDNLRDTFQRYRSCFERLLGPRPVDWCTRLSASS